VQQRTIVLILAITASCLTAAMPIQPGGGNAALSVGGLQPQSLDGVKLRCQSNGVSTDAIDTLQNDNDTLYYFFRYGYYWMARLTPTAVCSLQTVSIYKYALDTLGWVAGCSLFIYSDSLVSGHSYPGHLVASGYGVDTLDVGYNVLISNYNATGVVAGPTPFWVGWKCVPIAGDTLFPLTDNFGPSWRNAIAATRATWSDFGYDLFHRAVVNYFSAAATHDVGIAGLDNSRGFFLSSPDDAVISCDVFNGGDTLEANFPVVCSVYTEAGAPVTGFNETFTLDVAPGETIPYVFNTHWQPATAGVYRIKVKTALAGDVRPANDQWLREAQVCGNQAVLRYDDNQTPENAYAFYRAGNMFLNKFVPASYPALIDTVYARFWDNTWPTPGGNGAIIEVWLDSAGIPVHQAFCDTTTITRGVWNAFALPAPIRVDSGAFLVGYRQADTMTLSPGLCVDETQPISMQSWAFIGDSIWYYNYLNDGDFMLRAKVRKPSAPPPTAGWTETAQVPLSPSGKAVKDGGWVAWDASQQKYFAAKAYKTGDFYSYDPATSAWSTLPSWPNGVEAKPPYKGAVGVSDGNGTLYATKGNNNTGFWKYTASDSTWTQLADVPLGLSGKKVKGGTDLVYVNDGGIEYVYLLKGYKCEFYRFDIAAGTWQTLAEAPVGVKAKYDKGSWLVYDETSRKLYAHKAKYSELYAYSLDSLTWGPLIPGMPLANGQTGKNKKAKDGSDAVVLNGLAYSLKGGNTIDFYALDLATLTWAEKETIPSVGSTGKKKRVKGGGSMATDGTSIFALKGNKTVEAWRYGAAGAAAPAPLRGGAMARNSAARGWFALGANPVAAAGLTVRYSLPKAGPASLRVFDVTGRTVLGRSLVAGRAGTTELDLRSLSAGIYLVQLEAEGYSGTHKLVVQR
jgi:hypothetical protein